MDLPNSPPPADGDVNSYDVLAVLPSLCHSRWSVRTKEALRDIQRRLGTHRATLEAMRQDEVAFDSFLEAFQWAWGIARATDSPTMREAAYAGLAHCLPGGELDALTQQSMFRLLARFDERHIALLSAMKAGATSIPNDGAGIMRQIYFDLVYAGLVQDTFVTPLGYRFWRFVTA